MLNVSTHGLKKSCANLALFIFLFNIVTPVFAANLSVDVNSDNNAAGCELREAVNSVNAAIDFGDCINSGDPYGTNDTINVTPPGNTITLTQGEIEVKSSVVITGAVTPAGDEPAVTIDGNNASRIFNIDSDDDFIDVEINHLNLTNGQSTTGGLVFLQNSSSGGELSMNNVNLTNGHALENGGAVYVGDNNSLFLTDTEVSNNVSDANGGGVFLGENTSLEVVSTGIYTDGFNNNEAESGGALYISSTPSVAIVNGGDFNSNNAVIDGGAVYSAGGGLEFNNSSFQNNTARTGGAVYNSDGAFTHTSGSYSNNTAAHTDDSDYNGVGGAVFILNESAGEDVYIADVDFIENTSTARGGAIFVQLSELLGSSQLILENLVFNNNESLFDGGAITATNIKIADIISSTFENNIAEAGAAIYGFIDDFSISNSSFTSNSSILGGAIYGLFNDLFISDSSFTSNSADQGGALFLDGSSDFQGQDIIIENTHFFQNIASELGGAIFCFTENYFCNLTISADAPTIGFVENEAPDGGSAIYTSPVILVAGCDGCPPGTVSIAGLPVEGLLSLTNILFDGNITNAPIFFNSSPTAAIVSANEITLLNSIFQNNIGQSTILSYNDMDLTNTNFINNIGSAIYNLVNMPANPNPILIEIRNSLFDGNDGGGIIISNSLQNSIEFTFNVFNSIFRNNIGPSVSAIDLPATSSPSSAAVNITDSYFHDNQYKFGFFLGGTTVSSIGPALNLINSTIANNASAGVNVNTFGGIVSSIVNSTVTNNDFVFIFANQGGGVRNSSGILNIIHSTIANNFARNGIVFEGFGGGIASTNNGIINLTNSIISDNQADQAGPDCYVASGGSIISNGNNLISDTTGCTYTSDPDDIVGVSALLEILDYNGGLTPTRLLGLLSPALDAGDDALATATDQRGAIRPQGLASDIGAVEMGIILNPDPVIAEVIPVPTPTADTTPNYTFSSTEAGSITYGGDCSSATSAAVVGNNTITFNTLAVGIHNNCTILVTDSGNNDSNLLSVSSFQIISVAEPPVIAEVTAVPTPDTDTTPNYTFSSTEAGSITYGGDCSSATNAAVVGNNTITFNTLAVGIHSNCTILVTDSGNNNDSYLLNVSSFEITAGPDLTPPTIAEVIPVPTPTTDTTPNYTFSSNEAGTITYGGSCSSPTALASIGNNTITFNILAAGDYTNCTITVTDGSTNVSNLLSVSPFTITNPPTPPSGGGGGGGAGGGFGQPASGGTPSNPPSEPQTPSIPEPSEPAQPNNPEQPTNPETPSEPEQPNNPTEPSPSEEPTRSEENTFEQPDNSQPERAPLEEEIIFVTEENPTETSSENAQPNIFNRDTNKTTRQLSLSCNYTDFSTSYGIIINQNSDADGDGLSDELECLAQTNPTEIDTDGDGLSDAFEELTLGSNPRQSDGQLGDDFLIITTPEDNMLTGDESPLVKGINTLKGDVDIYIFDQGDFDDFAKQLQDELNANENLNDQQRSELYAQRFTEYVQTILSKFIADILDPENPDEAKFINRIQLLGETPTGNNSVFLLDSDKTLVDNIYLAMAHNKDDMYSRETEFEVDSSLKILNPSVSTLGNKPIPTEALLGNLKIQIDPGNFRPILAGDIKEPSKVVANWQSDIISSALIADSLDEEFRLSAPADLEPGEHAVYVTAYRRSDGAQSETLKIPFSISADGTIIVGENNNLWIYLGLGVIVLGGTIFIISKKSRKQSPPPSSTSTTN